MTITSSKDNTAQENIYNQLLLDYLKTFSLNDLTIAANQLCISHNKLNKNELINKLYAEMLKPETMERRFSIMPNDNIKIWDTAITKERFNPLPKELPLIMPFILMGYMAEYSDHSVEIPAEVKTVYKQINTEAFQKKRQQLSWLMDCEEAFAALHVVAPLEIFHKMYIQKRGCKISLEDFKLIFAELPDNFNQCILRNDKIILKDVLKDNFYLKLEKSQKTFSFYIPTVKEISSLSEHNYLKDEVIYKELYQFLRKELKQNVSKAHYYCGLIYNNFNMGENIDTIFETIKNLKDIEPLTLNNDEQKNRFYHLVQKAANKATRMYCLRGHTLRELNLQLPSSNHFNPEPSLGWDINTAEAVEIPMPNLTGKTANNRVGSKAKKVYPNDPCPCGSSKKYKKCCRNKK